MGGGIRLRPYHSADCAEMTRLFYETIHTVCAADYSARQLDAWAPREIDPAMWNRRFLRDETVVAVIGSVIAGYGTLTADGVFDLLYVHKNFQRRGVAARIAGRIEQIARESGVAVISTEASVTARPFFERQGYTIIAEQAVAIRGQVLTNYRMQKALEPSP